MVGSSRQPRQSVSSTVIGSLLLTCLFGVTRLDDADELDLSAEVPGFRCRDSEIFD